MSFRTRSYDSSVKKSSVNEDSSQQDPSAKRDSRTGETLDDLDGVNDRGAKVWQKEAPKARHIGGHAREKLLEFYNFFSFTSSPWSLSKVWPPNQTISSRFSLLATLTSGSQVSSCDCATEPSLNATPQP